jgi:hypothetical protein
MSWCVCAFSSSTWTPAESTLSAGVDGLRLDDVHEDTVPVSSKPVTRPDVTPLIVPIYNTSTYTVRGVDHYLNILKEVRGLGIGGGAHSEGEGDVGDGWRGKIEKRMRKRHIYIKREI